MASKTRKSLKFFAGHSFARHTAATIIGDMFSRQQRLTILQKTSRKRPGIDSEGDDRMVLSHFVALLRKLFRNSFEAMAEASELRRTMARRHPHMEE